MKEQNCWFIICQTISSDAMAVRSVGAESWRDLMRAVEMVFPKNYSDDLEILAWTKVAVWPEIGVLDFDFGKSLRCER